MQILENISLRQYNSFGFEVSARYFAEISEIDHVLEALDFASEKGLSLLVIGGGSNLILTDDIDGLVLVNRFLGKEVLCHHSDSVEVAVGGGENWHDFVCWGLEQGYSGLENLSLIPGTVCATPP